MAIKTIFIGTPDFAIPSLKALLADNDFEIVGVITQPDKKVGRKQILTPPPVKVLAQQSGLQVFQPEKIKDFQLSTFNFQLIIVVAYAQIIPESILNLPKYGCINVHGSLLPKYRGAACIQAAIINGDTETGVTIMKMDKELDTGSIIFQDKVKIENNDTAGTLFDKLSELGGKILPGAVKEYIDGSLALIPQDNNASSYVGLLKKSDGIIDWSKDAVEVERFVRAMHPWPGAHSSVQKNDSLTGVKIISVEHEVLNESEYSVGELFLADGKLAVKCGKGALIIKTIQLEGKKEIGAEDFLRGHKELVGKVLG